MTFVRETSSHGVVRTIAVERAFTHKTVDGRTDRYVFGRWHTRFGGWTSRPEWHLLTSK